ncbi:MAG: PglZ domain-containing protein, partial [Anaerolineales bacterium]|nr:PglZ domain-containing protein [Anaerolineales bacterium]
MISIQYDPNLLLTRSSPDLCVDSFRDYLLLYQKLLEAIPKGQSLTVVIQNGVIHEWLKKMAVRYPQGTFVFESVDARSVLAKQWGVEVPPSVSNQEILQLNLLALHLTPQPGFSFADILLAHFYAPIFTSKNFPQTQITVLLNAVDPQRWAENRRSYLLWRTLDERIEAWRQKADSVDQRRLIEAFAADPGALKRQLMAFRVLRHYPSLGANLLKEWFELFLGLKLSLDDLEISEDAIADVVTHVNYWLNEQKVDSADNLLALIESVSGLLRVEFDTVEKILRDHPEWASKEIIDQIEEKFFSLHKRLSRRIAALRVLIQPPKPFLPQADWGVDQMLHWLEEAYFPYQAWCDAQEQFDNGLYSIGDRFSEWLLDHWEDLRANSKRMVFNFLPNIAADLKQGGMVNLVLVIDNLGWSYAEMLIDRFQQNHFFLTSIEPYFSMLPTETEISKKCLLSGAIGYQMIDDKTYQGIIEKGWVPYFNHHDFRYLSDIGKLAAIKTIDALVYVVNYLAIDKALHQSKDELGISHREHIRHLLENLVNNCLEFVEKHGLQEKLRIHVISDHGSTRIPTEINNDLNLSIFKSEGFRLITPRLVAVSQNRFAQLVDNLKVDCFFLPANDFLLPEPMLCARRANRFVPTNRNTYVHGGLLPEEVVVPYLLFEPIGIPIQNLTVLLHTDQFRYRLETVELEVGNPNHQAVENISILILNGNVECEPIRIKALRGKTKTNVRFNARFRQTLNAEDQSNLRLHVRFSARGEPYVFDTSLKITMKKMVEEKTSTIFFIVIFKLVSNTYGSPRA